MRGHVTPGDGAHRSPGLTPGQTVDALLAAGGVRDVPPAGNGSLVEGGPLVVPLTFHGYDDSEPGRACAPVKRYVRLVFAWSPRTSPAGGAR